MSFPSTSHEVGADVCRDSVDPWGQKRTWLWFKITKPLLTYGGNAPPELTREEQSYVVFAIPTLQIMKLREE